MWEITEHGAFVVCFVCLACKLCCSLICNPQSTEHKFVCIHVAECIDAQRCGNSSRFMNHYRGIADLPNVRVETKYLFDGVHQFFFAERDILLGEQLLIDYGRYYADGHDWNNAEEKSEEKSEKKSEEKSEEKWEEKSEEKSEVKSEEKSEENPNQRSGGTVTRRRAAVHTNTYIRPCM